MSNENNEIEIDEIEIDEICVEETGRPTLDYKCDEDYSAYENKIIELMEDYMRENYELFAQVFKLEAEEENFSGTYSNYVNLFEKDVFDNYVFENTNFRKDDIGCVICNMVGNVGAIYDRLPEFYEELSNTTFLK